MSSPDSSLTFHSLLDALDTVGDDDLGYVLAIPFKKRTSRDDNIKYYIDTHPNAGWNHLAGILLKREQHSALEKMKGNVTADKGKCGVDDTY